MTLDRRDLLLGAGGAVAGLAMAGAALGQTPVDEAASPVPHPEVTPGPDGRAFYDFLDNETRINVINLRHIEQEAEKILPPESFAYIASGSGDEWTMRQNEEAFNDWVIEPNYLAGIDAPELSTTLLGTPLSLPVITAPMGGQGRAHALKEIPTIRGTHAAGTLYTNTTVANLSIEEIAEAGADGPKWFQIYFPRDRAYAREQLQRARDAGYSAIVITVDSTTFSNRERPTFLGAPSPNFGPGNVPLDPEINALTAGVLKRDLNWDDVAFCKEVTGLPVIVKGILTPGLARETVRQGFDGVWVSNHGGRGADKLAASITALPRIADAVSGDVPIVIDSGFRRGQDVFEALALGADAVALGRPVLYGLALGGAQGVEAVYQRLRTELNMVMQLAGTADIASITRDHVARLRDL